jgi:hypothetical protein
MKLEKQKNHIPAAELLSKKSKRSLMFGPKGRLQQFML